MLHDCQQTGNEHSHHRIYDPEEKPSLCERCHVSTSSDLLIHVQTFCALGMGAMGISTGRRCALLLDYVE